MFDFNDGDADIFGGLGALGKKAAKPKVVKPTPPAVADIKATPPVSSNTTYAVIGISVLLVAFGVVVWSSAGKGGATVSRPRARKAKAA